MNRKNKILVGCLALLLVMSVGYALFSDTITINGTATAKGDFNITPVCISGTVLDLEIQEHGYNNEVCSADDVNDTITFGINFDFPGAKKAFTIKLTNTGTIDSTFPNSIVNDSENSKFCLADSVDKDPQTEGECANLESHNDYTFVPYAVQVGEGTIYDISDISSLPLDVQQAFSNGTSYVLKPGNSVYYYVTLTTIDVDALNYPYDNMINSYMKFYYQPTFNQITN